MARAGLGLAIRQLRGLFGGGSVVGLEDSQLLARYASNRDEAAFEALIERHGSMVLTICRAVLKNEHDSEDAFQATFLVLARRAGSIRTANALGGWLHRVAYRASVQAQPRGRETSPKRSPGPRNGCPDFPEIHRPTANSRLSSTTKSTDSPNRSGWQSSCATSKG